MGHPCDDLVAHLPQLRGFARSLTGGDRYLADDPVQDTVMLALRSWDRFTTGTNLGSWRLKILHSRFYSLIRRGHVTAKVGGDELPDRGAVPARQEGRVELAEFTAAFAEPKAA